MIETPADRCRRYRRRILGVSQQVSAAHVAPAFSCVEIVDALYREVMREQDIFIMSKGHGVITQYVVLEDIRWKQVREQASTGLQLLGGYCKPDGRLGAHPDYALDLGIHASTGSLGHGLGIAVGQAYAEKLKGSDVQVYVLLSDGECQEGSTWEAVMVAANLGLYNLTALVDNNDYGGMDRMSVTHPALYPLPDKFRAFGWSCRDEPGHDSTRIIGGIGGRIPYKPHCVVCKTVKGKGVSFMENAPLWHYRSCNAAEFECALCELQDE